MKLYTSENDVITLTQVVGKGGEATVYEVTEHPDLVAKVYHHPTATHEAKLQAMVANPPEQPTTHTAMAWPTQLLYQVSPHAEFVGFLMPKVTGYEPLFKVYNPVLRKLAFPLFTTESLHRIGRNLAVVVETVHVKGYVIGDLNESNVLVNERGLVVLVDCDSFQVKGVEGEVYRCEVGKAEYTPPELQGVNFREVDQGAEHDLFGLGVLLFQLLMEGHHPFAGVLTTSLSVERVDLYAIRQGWFPYDTLVIKDFTPPPHAPKFQEVSMPLQNLWHQCFIEGHNQPSRRPSATEWQRGLQLALSGLVTCAKNPAHIYAAHLTTCPGCKTQAVTVLAPKPIVNYIQPRNNLPARIVPFDPVLLQKKIPSIMSAIPFFFVIMACFNLMALSSGVFFVTVTLFLCILLAIFMETRQLEQDSALSRNVLEQGKATEAKIVRIENGVIRAKFAQGYHADLSLEPFMASLFEVGQNMPLLYFAQDKINLFVLHKAQMSLLQLLQEKLAAAKTAYQHSNYDSALVKLNTLIHVDIDHPLMSATDGAAIQQIKFEAIYYRGQVYQHMGRAPEAMKDFKFLLKHKPHDSALHCYLGQLYLSQQQDHYAQEQYDKALTFDPANPLAHYGQGQVYQYQKNYSKAITHYSQAIALNYAPLGVPYVKRGQIYAKRRHFTAALADFSLAIMAQYDPLSEVYFERGLVYQQLEQFDNAQADWQIALTLESDANKRYQIEGYLRSISHP